MIERGLDPQVSRTRQNALSERQEAFHVHFLGGLGMSVDLRQGQLLAEPVALPLVGRLIDRLREQEGLIEPIELVRDRLRSPAGLRRAFARFGLYLSPDLKDSIVHEAHVAGRRLQQRQFINEKPFKFGLRDVHHAALILAVVVGVVLAAPFRPTGGQRPRATLATDEPTEREVGVASRPRSRNRDTTIEHRLSGVERRFRYKRLEVAAPGHAKVSTRDLAHVEAIAKQVAETLRRHFVSLARA